MYSSTYQALIKQSTVSRFQLGLDHKELNLHVQRVWQAVGSQHLSTQVHIPHWKNLGPSTNRQQGSAYVLQTTSVWESLHSVMLTLQRSRDCLESERYRKCAVLMKNPRGRSLGGCDL